MTDYSTAHSAQGPDTPRHSAVVRCAVDQTGEGPDLSVTFVASNDVQAARSSLADLNQRSWTATAL